MAATWYLLASVLLWLHWFPGQPVRFGATRTDAAAYMMFLPILFTSIGPGLLLSNWLGHAIGPWRRVLDLFAGPEAAPTHAPEKERDEWPSI